MSKKNSSGSSFSVMVIAGDVSGDHHASSFVRQFFKNFPDSQIWGIGGPKMQAEGFRTLMPFEPFNKMGFVEVFKNLHFFLKTKKDLVKKMNSLKPDCLVCVDYPGFNMPMMKAAYKAGIPVVWYIAPMVWAWKQNRAKILGKFTSHIACIFPFETSYFSPYTPNVSFIGNPLVEAINDESLKVSDQSTLSRLAIVPGSRWQEVQNNLTSMVESFKLLKQSFPHLNAVVSYCGNMPISFYEKAIENTGIKIETGPLRDLLSNCDIALVTSGTATLEAALLGVPLVTVYKTSWTNYVIFKRLLKIPYISLPNIIANEKIISECIQNDMNPQKMAEEVSKFLTDRQYYKNVKDKLIALRNLLGSKRPSEQLCSILKKILQTDSD